MKNGRRLVIASLLASAWLLPVSTPAHAEAQCYQIFNNNYNVLRDQGWSHERAFASALATYDECRANNDSPETDIPAG
ncbi:hypothetical protein [Streptosporangium roseum]|uniref:Secreted protein n=1 Tax=Streptosporangium roseum (strain ATCC 12428 / DSM 43021 / JCM 3005 / KCTC 9067 / NCIMB 10171 / NRRL 2505 / NI 9100) TaxID=479432 RepID=D2BF70_STRRD|nr:hypothetical protein [Streptosporangium roseum]ACZ88228.1 hypothetical protein Sros_5471 [Streptosporangium roseum DSM 43021]